MYGRWVPRMTLEDYKMQYGSGVRDDLSRTLQRMRSRERLSDAAIWTAIMCLVGFAVYLRIFHGVGGWS